MTYYRLYHKKVRTKDKRIGIKEMNIIAVDDEKRVLANTINIVQDNIEHDSISGFTSCKEAILYIKTHNVDVVLLDISMPEMNGVQFAIKCKEIKPDINLIFITAYSEYAVETYKLRPSGYLLKP